MAEGPARFVRVGGVLDAAGLAAAWARALQRGRVVKNETETLLVHEPGDAPDDAGRWWKFYRVPLRRRPFAWVGRSRAAREWRALRAMAEAGLPVVETLATGEERRGPLLRGSLLLTAEVPGARDLRGLWEDPSIGVEARMSLAADAGRAAARLHAAGFGHLRMQLRNLLRRPDGELVWLDAPYACRWPGPAPRGVRTVDLVDLAGRDSPLAEAEAAACLAAYASAANWSPPLEPVRRRSRLRQKLRRIAAYLLAVNGGRRIPSTP